MPFRRQILEHVRAGRPLPGRGLAGAGQAHLAEQHVADLLRRAGRELLAGDLLDLGLEPGERLGEIARQPRQDLPVDGDAAHLHAGDHVDERALEAVVDLGAPLGGKARLEEQPQPERHVGLLGRIRGRLVDRHAVEADGGLAGAGDRLEVDGRVPEVAVGELGHGVAGKAVAAGVEHVGDEEGVVDGRDVDAVALQHHPVGLDVVADLEDGAVLEHGLQPRDHLAGRELARREPAAEKIVLAAMPERHIAGLARREGERHADEIGPVRIERIGLGVEGEDAGFARPGEDGVELLDRGDAAIRLGVERDLGDLGRALGGKRRRHHHGCRLALGDGRTRPVRAGAGRRAGALRRLAALGRLELRLVPRDPAGAGAQPRIGLDLGDVDRIGLGDAADELVQLERLEEGDEALRIEAVEGEVLGRHGERGIAVEGDEPLRDERLVGVLQHLAGRRADGAGEVAGPHQRSAERVIAAEPLEGLGIGGRPALLVEGQVRDAELLRQHLGDLAAGVDLDRLPGERVDLALERREPLLEARVERVRPVLVGEDRLERAELGDQRRGGLRPDAGHARHVVGRIADERLHVRHLLRRHAELLDDGGAVEPPLRPVAGLARDAGFEVVEGHAVMDELHQILVGRHDQGLGAGLGGAAGIGRDEIVGLEARLLDRDQAEGLHGLAHERELRHELRRRIGAVRLVVGVDLLAEGVLGLVEDDGEVGRLDADRALADELVELGAEQAQRPGRQPVGRAHVVLPVLVHGLEVGAEDEGGAVDQEDLVAGFQRAGGRRGRALRRGGHGRGGHGLEIAERGRRRHRRPSPSYGDRSRAMCFRPRGVSAKARARSASGLRHGRRSGRDRRPQDHSRERRGAACDHPRPGRRRSGPGGARRHE